MEEEVKSHLRELYKRQQNELKALANIRLKVFESGLYEVTDELHRLESELLGFNQRIANYFDNKKSRFASNNQNAFLRDNVD
jgi:hypothetical protein